MDESVALDSSKQKQFVKSVRGIKKLIKKKEKTVKGNELPGEKISEKKEETQTGKIKKRKNRGLVYLSHIPHGFYEQQMTEYFKQFGVVTNVRVIRSKRTGQSKGYAFVEFKEPTVAQIVAETMNNYLMGKRLLKAAYIPPEKQRRYALRKHWNAQNNPASLERMKLKKINNGEKSDEKELAIAKKILLNLTKTKSQLRELGIDYDFFEPVDVPEVLKDQVKTSSESNSADVKSKKKIKLESETTNVSNKTDKVDKKSNTEVKKENKKKKQITPKIEIETSKSKKVTEQVIKKAVPNAEVQKESKVQKAKQDKLKKAGVKAPEEFIGIKEASSGDSDSSFDFDSDEFEQMMENDSNASSGDDTGDSADEEIVDDKKDSKKKKQAPAQKGKAKSANLKTQGKIATSINIPAPIKRKSIQNVTETPKKAKFEKQNKGKTLNKVIKKKK